MAQTNTWALGFIMIHSFCYMIIVFVAYRYFEHFASNKEKTLSITVTQDENKHFDPVLLLRFLIVLYEADISAKFEKKNLDSTSVSRELS